MRKTLRSCASVGLAMAAMLYTAPAHAFACYVGESAAGPVLLYKRPDAASRVVARLESNFMVGDGRHARERNGWVFVRWSRTQSSQAEFERGKGDGKGWMRREDIRGECED